MNPIYNTEMWEGLVALLSDNLESPYLCDNSFEFKGLWNGDTKEEIMKLAEDFLEDSGNTDGYWYIEDYFLFSSTGIDEQELATGEDMDQYRIAIRLEFCKYMLKLSNERDIQH